MADDALAPTENPFDQLDPEKVGTIAPPKEEPAPAPTASNDNQEKNPFDDLGEVGQTPVSAAGAFGRGAERGVVPAATGLIGAGLGGAGVVAAGAAAGTTVGPWGTVAGGIAGALAGGYFGSAAQDWVLKKLPDSWVDTLGMDDRQQRLDETQHATASFLGGLVPYAVTMRPSLSFAAKDLPENATALQKIMANPTTARLFGGAAVGGMELGQEAAHGDVDWSKVAISTAFGVVFDKPTKLGESLTNVGARPFRPATVAQAGDLKVMGPGITEDVFQGSHEQAPTAAMTAQEAARTEQTASGEAPEPDVHAVARQMHPELFDHYDELLKRRDIFGAWHGEGVGAEAAEKHLAATNAEIAAISPEIAAAYRRAAETTGIETVEPEPFPSFAAMLAAHEHGGGNVEARAVPAVPHEPPLSEGAGVPGMPGVPPGGEAPANIEGQAGVAGPVIPGPQRSLGEQKSFIANDVAQKLIAAGRPEEEARAAGQVVAARYATRAGRFEGKLGTAEELYRKEGAEIAGAGGKPLAPNTGAKELAQREYPIAPRSEWYGEANYEKTGGRLERMTPDEFLAKSRPLKMDPESRENIDLLKEHIENGKTLDPLALYQNGKEDGRHRAYAAKELGITEIPVINFRKPEPTDLFQEAQAKELEQVARGKIRLAPGQRPIITLLKDANASTFIHESGHDFLEQLMRDGDHPDAPPGLRDDAQTVRDWFGVGGSDEIKTKHHEKFARGFEQYMREGVAPSQGLARVFAQFRNWLLSIYQSIKGLGTEISPEIRDVFDRMLEMEPKRTVIAPEQPSPTLLHDIHEAEAATVEPHEAEATADRIVAERDRYIQDQPPEIARELEAATVKVQQAEAGAPGAPEGGAGAGGSAEVGEGGGGPGAEPGGGVGGEEHGAIKPGGGAGVSEGAERTQPDRRSKLGDTPGTALAPGPADLFGAAESPFTDRAGNIRLENLSTTEDVRQAIRDSAAENNDFIGDRRGVITDGQVLELADALGMDAARLNQRKLGQAFNAEQIIAARKLLIESATQVSAAMKKAATGTDEDVMAYAMAKDRHQMIQANVAGITAEAGRALRAFRKLPGQEAVAAVDQMLKEATGKTLFQLKQEAKMGAALQTPQQVSKFMQDSQRRGFGRMILEYWINGLISGPATHSTYMVGNTILSLVKVGPETAAAAFAGRAAELLGREGTRVRLGEVGAQLHGIKEGLAPALQAAGGGLRTGVTTQLPGEGTFAQGTLPFQPGTELALPAQLNENATFRGMMADTFGVVRGLRDGIVAAGALLKSGGVPGSSMIEARYSPLGAIPDITVRGMNVLPLGSTVRLPGRFIAAIHSFFRAINFSMEKNAIAYRTAADEGLTGHDFDARVAEIRQSPSDSQMNEAAAHEATQLTLMGKGGEFTQALGRLTNANILGFPLLKFVDPFVHISSNIIEQALLQRTPVGVLAPEIRADLMGRNGNIAQDRAVGRMLMGTALSITFGGLASQGLMSGSGPKDPKESAMWRLAGNQAHSVRIGDIWYDVHKLGPLGLLAGMAADIYEVSHQAVKGELLEAAAHLQHAFTQNILDESFMRGPAELMQAIEDPGRYGQSYIRNFLSQFAVPFSVGMGQVARAMDPYSRQTRTVIDAIKNKVPGLSETLYPRRDIWGEAMPNHEALMGKGFTAIYETHMSNDPVNQAMLKLGIFPGAVEKKIRNIELTPQQYDDYARIAGRTTKMRLDSIARSPDFQTWPDNIKHDVMAETIKQSREAARGMIMMKYPDLVHAAVEDRIARAKGEKKK